MSSRRPLFFYASWPLEYHNREAARKAIAFTDAGYDVVYVSGVGYRNPGPASAGKLLDVAVRRIRGAKPHERHEGLRTAGVAVLPPRQLAPMRRLNAALMRRQLAAAVSPWHEAVAWIRQETPEVVDALTELRPAVTVYECVDAHHVTPGMRGPWARIFDDAQRRLVELADVVVVTSETLADRFAGTGADIRHIPHGVDLFPWRPPDPAGRQEPLTVGYLGVVDARLDIPVIRRIAELRPDWHIRLIGPVERGFDPSRLAGLPNVGLEPPVPHERIGEVLADFDVGFMPYAPLPAYRHMSPLKNLELMAAGRPAVARPTPSLDRFGDLLYFAETGEEFVAQIERAASEDSVELARRRRLEAEQHDWRHTLGKLEALLEELLARRAVRRA